MSFFSEAGELKRIFRVASRGSCGGDADTQGAIAGAIAEAYFGVPIELEDKARE